jgi:hypothetical protein
MSIPLIIILIAPGAVLTFDTAGRQLRGLRSGISPGLYER